MMALTWKVDVVYCQTIAPSTYSNKTVVIYLIGLAGTGKYTIAKKISNRGYKVVDNHLINNPIFSLLGKDGARNTPEGTTEKINRIRRIVLEFIQDDHYSNYVLTNQLLENPYHHETYNEISTTANKRGSVFVPVKLIISNEERAKRIVQPDRGKRFKITDVKEAYRPKNVIKISHDNLLELNVSHLTAEEAAEKIIQHVKNIQNVNPQPPT